MPSGRAACPTVIINPVAGARRSVVAERVDLAHAVFKTHGLQPTIVLTEGPLHAFQLAQEARRQGASLVVAWGGDGTINEVASALVSGPTPLAVVPAGSGNGFARHLGLPREAARALDVAVRGPERSLDVGELAGRFFFNVAGIGFDAHVAQRVNSRPRGRGGPGRYMLGALREFATYEPIGYEILADGTEFKGHALLIALANGREYGYGATIAPGAQIDDGQLDALIAEPRPLFQGLWDARRLFTASIVRAPGIRVHRFREATINVSRECLAHVDGEPIAARGPFLAKVHQGALRVRVGA